MFINVRFIGTHNTQYLHIDRKPKRLVNKTLAKKHAKETETRC